MKIIRIILAVLALMAPVWVGWVYISEADKADICLDQGGSYDYINSVCSFEEGYPFIPFFGAFFSFVILK